MKEKKLIKSVEIFPVVIFHTIIYSNLKVPTLPVWICILLCSAIIYLVLGRHLEDLF